MSDMGGERTIEKLKGGASYPDCSSAASVRPGVLIGANCVGIEWRARKWRLATTSQTILPERGKLAIGRRARGSGWFRCARWALNPRPPPNGNGALKPRLAVTEPCRIPN
jgi:hypothetical protein